MTKPKKLISQKKGKIKLLISKLFVYFPKTVLPHPVLYSVLLLKYENLTNNHNSKKTEIELQGMDLN